MGIFSKITGSANRTLNKNAMEAGAASGLLVAVCEDGVASKDEVTNVVTTLMANPKVAKSFSRRDVEAVVGRYTEILEANFRSGRLQMLREIAQVAGNIEDAEDVLVLAISSAEKEDKKISDVEMKTLKDIADALNMKLESYL